MSLVASLLTALVRADGDALVLHTGECPYVVAPTGQTELASRALTLEAATGVVAELLPADARQALNTVGAVQHDLRPADFAAGETFTVVAARGGDDIWVEIRRHRNSGAAPSSKQPYQTAGLDRLLRIAAERGASTVYLTSQARPCIRVEGEIRAIEGEGVLSEHEVRALIADMFPNVTSETGQAGTECTRDLADVGRVRGITFTDHKGPGAIFRLVPERAISAEQLRLPQAIRDLCAERDGLIIVAGPRASGKSTLISAFVDIINRTRSDFVITLERRIDFVHVNRGSLISQRELRDDDASRVADMRAAIRERPDVLVIDDVSSPEIGLMALEAAHAGHLVLAGLLADTATDAVDRVIGRVPPHGRERIQAALAAALRGIVAQRLVRKARGGWVAAREVLFNTGAVTSLIADGSTSQLPLAIENGRADGMTGFSEVLAGFVCAGIVDAREAYRHAPDKPEFLSLLARSGVDTAAI